MSILITGGAGYIGTHTLLALHDAGYSPVVIDNLSNSTAESFQRAEEIADDVEFPFYEADLRNRSVLEQIFRDHSIDTVIHFAGLKAVGESVSQPLRYYANNLESTLTLLNVMEQYDCYQVVFSSSATVYGVPQKLPLTEDHLLSASNPYGRTKLMIEQMLTDLAQSDPLWRIALLRYFNPVGAHPSGRIGEAPLGAPNNLFPCITQFMSGVRPELKIFGDDYPTRDGSGVRDYLHVSDLAKGHVSALKNLEELEGAVPINLGTGKGYSVLEVIRLFEEVSGRSIPYQIAPRRPGDVAECYADASKAKRVLGWQAEYGLLKMVEDSWRWEKQQSPS